MLFNHIKQHLFSSFYYLKAATLIIVAAFISGVIVKAYFLSYYEVPSGSMEETILPGDGILVSKLNYGPGVDWGSLLPFQNNYPDKRLPEYSKVQRGNVIVFKSTADNKTLLVKRCIGTPGDSVLINQTDLFVNRKKMQIEKAAFDYRLISADNNDTRKAIALKLTKDQWKYNSAKKAFYLTLNDKNAAYFSRLKSTLELNKIEKEPGNNKGLFPMSMQKEWSRDNYGPLLVPGKNVTIRLTIGNLMIYAPFINHEGNKITLLNNTVLINSEVSESYTFKDDYYFVMGDNRSHSYDSRWLGFIPRENVIGEPLAIVFSADSATGKIRFNRIFDRIR